MRRVTLTVLVVLIGTILSLLQTVQAAPPEITCPSDLILECEEPFDYSPDVTGFPIVTDDDDPDPEVTYVDLVTGCPATIHRTWTATDNGGLLNQCVQIISLGEDTESPVVSIEDVQILVGASVYPANTGMPSVVDCDPQPTFDYVDEMVEINIIERTWTVTDHCQNFSTVVQYITIGNGTWIYLAACCGTIGCIPPAWIDATPDMNGDGGGTSDWFERYYVGGEITLIAPESHNGRDFDRWIISTDTLSESILFDSTSNEITLTLNGYDLETDTHYGLVKPDLFITVVYPNCVSVEDIYTFAGLKLRGQRPEYSSPILWPFCEGVTAHILQMTECYSNWGGACGGPCCQNLIDRNAKIGLNIELGCFCDESEPDSIMFVAASGTCRPVRVWFGLVGWCDANAQVHFLIDEFAGLGEYVLNVHCPGAEEPTVVPTGITLRYDPLWVDNYESGRVRNSLTGSIIPHGSVSLWRFGVGPFYSYLMTDFADEMGRYIFDDLEPDDYMIFAQANHVYGKWFGPYTVRSPIPYDELLLDPTIADQTAPTADLDTTSVEGLGVIQGDFSDSEVGVAFLGLVIAPDVEYGNVSLEVEPFEPGAPTASMTLSQLDPSAPGKATVQCVDQLGNRIEMSFVIEAPTTCCIAPSVGDLDQGGGDLGFNYDGADLSAMINGLFIDPTNGWDGICLDEADVDFTSARPVTDPMTVDGADLSLLIDALFIAPTHFLKNCDGTDNWTP